ncbi:acyl transferase [Nocardia sp. NPDC020380]|uniref:acyl transferase n=1 Tax=Nocardia sp. NPDC020380 TaxID=3364309 RepID=UPI00378A06D9
MPYAKPDRIAPRPVLRRLLITAVGAATCAAAIAGCTSSTTSPAPSQSTTTPSVPVTQSGEITALPTAPASTTVVPTTATAPDTTTPPEVTTSLVPPTSPVSPSSGTTFSGEGLTPQQATDLQTAVNSGHQPWRLDQVQVAKSFVQARFGWTSVQTSMGAPMVVFVTNSDGAKVSLHLTQPATQGDHGIWVVDSGVWD